MQFFVTNQWLWSCRCTDVDGRVSLDGLGYLDVDGVDDSPSRVRVNRPIKVNSLLEDESTVAKSLDAAIGERVLSPLPAFAIICYWCTCSSDYLHGTACLGMPLSL